MKIQFYPSRKDTNRMEWNLGITAANKNVKHIDLKKNSINTCRRRIGYSNFIFALVHLIIFLISFSFCYSFSCLKNPSSSPRSTDRFINRSKTEYIGRPPSSFIAYNNNPRVDIDLPQSSQFFRRRSKIRLHHSRNLPDAESNIFDSLRNAHKNHKKEEGKNRNDNNNYHSNIK